MEFLTMSVAKKAIKKKAKRLKKVLRITDFELIFEPTDAKRKKQKGPLSFTKELVTFHFLNNEAELKYFERMKALKAHADRHLLRSVFADIKNWTAGKYHEARGYLLTADLKPVTMQYLADQLEHTPVEDVKKAVPILLDIGLLERIGFDPDASGLKRLPLNNDKNNGNGNRKNKSNKQSTTTKTKKKVKKKVKGQGQSQEQTALAPVSRPEPNEPTKSDNGRGKVIQFTSPALSAKRSGEPVSIGQLAAVIIAKNDQHANDLAIEVFRALGYKQSLDSVGAKREIASFRSVISKAKYSLPPPSFESIMVRAIAEAEKIVKHWKNRRGKPAAVWNKVFKDIVQKHINTDNCKAV
jgi:hypothetical protein